MDSTEKVKFEDEKVKNKPDDEKGKAKTDGEKNKPDDEKGKSKTDDDKGKVKPNDEKGKVPNDESYTQRRLLFKDIWETAMNIDEKDDILNKPKVIKTLRLDEVDKMVVGKSRKQRIKNLRHVCKRILEFCDRQDADDKFYEQFAPTTPQAPQMAKTESPKKKLHKGKKKIKKIGSLFQHNKDVTVMKATVSERKKGKRRTSKVPSPIGRKKNSLVNLKAKPVKSRSPGNKSPDLAVASTANEMKGDPSMTRRKTKKKTGKKKNICADSTLQAISNIISSKTAVLARRTLAKVNSVKPSLEGRNMKPNVIKVFSTAGETNRVK